MPRTYSGGRDQSFGIDISPIVHQVLLEEVAPTVEEILRKHIQSDIYDAYTPQPGAWVDGETYERRHVLENSITSEIVDGDTLFVTSVAAASDPIVEGYEFTSKYPGAFLEMLASGNMGIWRSGFARPAVENAQAEVDNSSAIQAAIEQGVRRALSQVNR